MTVPFTSLPNWLFDPGVSTANEKIILLTINYRLGANDVCWPSHETIAADSGLSIATVKRTLCSLRSKGWIVWEKRLEKNGARKSNQYRLIIHDRNIEAVAHPELVVAHPELTPSSHRADPSLTVSDKQDSINKIQRTTHPPAPQRGEQPCVEVFDDRPVLVQSRSSSIVAPPRQPNEVLEPLKEAAVELCQFFNKHRHKTCRHDDQAWLYVQKCAVEIINFDRRDGGKVGIAGLKWQLKQAEAAFFNSGGWKGLDPEKFKAFCKDTKPQLNSSGTDGYNRGKMSCLPVLTEESFQ